MLATCFQHIFSNKTTTASICRTGCVVVSVLLGATPLSASLSVEEGSLPRYQEDECEVLTDGPLIVRVSGTYCAINTHTLRERQGSRRLGLADVGEYHMYRELYGPPY